jgi:putative acetyltransferase
VIVRPATPRDHAAIRAITTAAFDQTNGNEARIIEGVRAEGLALVELVAETNGEVVGHVLFNSMRTEPGRAIAGLGPLAVAPAEQGTGIGSALSRAGIEACRAAGMEAIVVLGHPPYYPRFGFSADAAANIASPFSGRAAFMAMALKPGALERPIKVDYPAAFG